MKRMFFYGTPCISRNVPYIVVIKLARLLMHLSPPYAVVKDGVLFFAKLNRQLLNRGGGISSHRTLLLEAGPWLMTIKLGA